MSLPPMSDPSGAGSTADAGSATPGSADEDSADRGSVRPDSADRGSVRPDSVATSAKGEDTDPLPTFGSFPPDFDWDSGLGYTPAGSPPPGFPATAERFTFPELSGRTRHHRNRTRLLGMGVAAGVLLAGGLIGWQLLGPSPAEPGGGGAGAQTSVGAAAPSGAERDKGAEARLMALLPKGYPAGACTPADPPTGAIAKLDCRVNVDPGGPLSASYLLVGDRVALSAAFDGIVRSHAVVTCPGNIQSPGPWRRNATPDRISGMLFCGFDQGRPTLAWTDEAGLRVSTVRSDANGPQLDQLYAWWSSHS